MAEKEGQDAVDDGGAAAEDKAAEVGVTMLDGGAVEVSVSGEERAARHGEDEHEQVETHDAQGNAYTDEEREQLRQQRRDEKKRRRNAARDREDRLRTTVDVQNRTISELTQRLAVVEQRGTVGELQQLEGKIREAADAANYFKMKMAEAVTANDGASAADFSAKMTQASNAAQQLNGVREQYLRSQQNQPQPLDPRHQMLANQWMSKNKWYNPSDPKDADSRVALALDDALHKEGFDPRDERYWTELTKRMTKYLPHRFKDAAPPEDDEDDDDGQDSRGAQQRDADRAPARREPPKRLPTAGGGSADNSGAAGTYRLSKERVDAMKDAGFWNDPAKRAKMIRRYIDEDKATRATRR